MKARTQSAKEKAFFSDHWNNRIVTMHMQGRTIEAIINEIKIIKNGVPISENHVMTIIGKYISFMNLNKVKHTKTATIGSKRTPYFSNEMEQIFPCVVAFSYKEKHMKVKPEHLDSNYQNFISS